LKGIGSVIEGERESVNAPDEDVEKDRHFLKKARPSTIPSETS